MDLDLLNLIPDEILNLIFSKIKPSIKYCLNKKYFYKFYKYRFILINNKYLFYRTYIQKNDFFFINNFQYLNFLIKKDSFLCVKYIIDNKIKYDNKNYILNNYIVYENKYYENTIDFIYVFSKKFNSLLIYNFIVDFIKKNKLTHLFKKQHKNNYKNNNKQTKWRI